MKMSKAIQKAKEGRFDFTRDAKIGYNTVRYQTASGKWKEKIIEIESD